MGACYLQRHDGGEMRWGKREPVKKDDIRPRCKQLVQRQYGLDDCKRLARLCRVTKDKYDAGELWLCLGHQCSLSGKGYKITRIDRRKRAPSVYRCNCAC